MRVVAYLQKYGTLDCKVESLFTLGSPMGLFMTLRGASAGVSSECRGRRLLPLGVRLYNLFHTLDPVAYRVEPLVLERGERMNTWRGESLQCSTCSRCYLGIDSRLLQRLCPARRTLLNPCMHSQGLMACPRPIRPSQFSAMTSRRGGASRRGWHRLRHAGCHPSIARWARHRPVL